MKNPFKFGWRYFKNRKPFIATINDMVARWISDTHEEVKLYTK